MHEGKNMSTGTCLQAPAQSEEIPFKAMTQEAKGECPDQKRAGSIQLKDDLANKERVQAVGKTPLFRS